MTQPTLRRAITLPLLILYGLGVTIGAGIYVLIGTATAQAGMFAPTSFLLAAAIMGFSAASFCELSGRYPQSAGEAVYVEAGFGQPALTLLVGGLMVLAATVSSAAIAVGGAGYVYSLVMVPMPVIIAIIVMVMGGIAAWGIVESVTFAAVLTVAEIVGLLVIVFAGLVTQPDLVFRLAEVFPPVTDTVALSAVFTTSLVAFFAFIGFDDMVNLVEETKEPHRALPIGILATLAIAALLYFLVVAVAVLSVPLPELARSAAPISLIFGHLTGLPPTLITLIAIVATLNGVVIQIVMASRVLYGLGEAGRLPQVFAAVDPVTRTPLLSTVLVTLTVLCLGLFLPIGILAERTTQIILVVFAFVNLSLVLVKRRIPRAPPGVFKVPVAIPVIGFITCCAMLVGPMLL